jgi:integrase
MLRHSYAIHTLLLLRSRPDIKLEPLMYVRDRLGHASVQTTMVYLQQIERLLGAEALAMMDEFDQLYGVSRALAAAPPPVFIDPPQH